MSLACFRKMFFNLAFVYNIIGLFHLCSCDIEIDTRQYCVFTLKYQISGEELVRDFYSGDRILKITNDYPDWIIKKFWEENTSEMSLITVGFLKNKVPQLMTLKEMKETDENLTTSHEIGFTHKILLDAIPTPITILSCRDLYYAFQNSVTYTLHFSNDQSIIEISQKGPVYFMIISGELHLNVTTRKGYWCQNIFNSGDLVYVPEGLSVTKFATRGRFLAIQMTWAPSHNKAGITCKPSTLQSLTINDMESNGSNYLETNNLRLNTGHLIPPLGFTIYNTGDEEAEILESALKLGYKLFHIITTYHGTKFSGEERLKIGMKKLRIERKDIFISVRMILKSMNHGATIESTLNATLKKLNTGYIDLVILELPHKDRSVEIGKELRRVWKSLNTIKATGKIHALGVCNVKDIQELVAIYNYEKDGLSVIENWFDLYRPDKGIRRRCRKLNIIYMAYGLFGNFRTKVEKIKVNRILTSPELKDIAGPYHLPISKLLLMWAMQKKIIVKPSTSDLDHLETNFYSTGLQIVDEQRQKLDNLVKLMPVEMSSHQNDLKGFKDEL